MYTKEIQKNHPAAESLLKVFAPMIKDVSSASKLFTGFPGVAIHMMITFYIGLLAAAIYAGPNGASPSLMQFILLWHILAIPTWIIRTLSLKLCESSLGMLIFFTLILVLLYFFQGHVIMGLKNLGSWIKL